MMETWRAVVGYEGIYEVSDIGRVKSLAREWTWGNGAVRRRGDLILSPGINSRGYSSVNLVTGGVSKNKTVHRLVANEFIPNNEHLPEINHKDGNKQNNAAENLEWATREGNQQHAYNTGLHEHTRLVCAKGCRDRFSKPVIQLSKDGVEIKTYPSENDAARTTGIFQANINKCIHGQAHSAGGFIWKRA